MQKNGKFDAYLNKVCTIKLGFTNPIFSLYSDISNRAY